jgi:hypothetical protein
MLTGELNQEEKYYTVADLCKETQQMVRKEMENLKKRPLNEKEIKETEGMARIMAGYVLKQMGIVGGKND